MSPQELQALENFLAQLTQARAGAKDPQAEARILDAAARQPDAAYLLVQRAMLLDQALASAQTQIVTLQNQLQAAQAGRSASFMDSANNWGSHANSAAPNPGFAPQQAAPMQMPPQAQPAQQAPAQPVRSGFFSGGLGSTLGHHGSRRGRRRAPVPRHRKPVPSQQRRRWRLLWPAAVDGRLHGNGDQQLLRR